MIFASGMIVNIANGKKSDLIIERQAFPISFLTQSGMYRLVSVVPSSSSIM